MTWRVLEEKAADRSRTGLRSFSGAPSAPQEAARDFGV